MFDKKDLMNVLEQIADILEYKNENAFKIKAFRTASQIIRSFGPEFETLITQNRLEEQKGIGKAIAAICTEFYETGYSSELEELRSTISPSILDMFAIRGLGPKKVSQLVTEAGIITVDDLYKACQNKKLEKISGFGDKTQEKLIAAIDQVRRSQKFTLLNTASKISDELLKKLKNLPGLDNIDVSGQMRRNCEIVDRIEYVILTEDLTESINALKILFPNHSIANNTFIVRDFAAIPIFLHFSETQGEYTRALFLTTGSPEFLDAIHYETIAKRQPYDEEGFFKIAKLPIIPPEMREGEYFSTENKELLTPSNLEASTLKGMLHFHTNFSDGLLPLKDMVIKGKRLGYKYFAVCDHSQSAVYAHGLKEESILLQKNEIEAVAAELNLPILHGIESDILADGSLDYPEDILKNFHLIVASIHSRFQMKKDEMTARVIKAVENPFTDILGHPTGRLLLERAPFEIDIFKVIDACSQNDVAIEINSSPHRLDLDWRYIFYARDKGCRFSINADAHAAEDIANVQYGVRVARKAGLQKKEVINQLNVNDFIKFINRKVKRPDVWLPEKKLVEQE